MMENNLKVSATCCYIYRTHVSLENTDVFKKAFKKLLSVDFWSIRREEQSLKPALGHRAAVGVKC